MKELLAPSRLPASLRQAGVIFLLTRGVLLLFAPIAYLILTGALPHYLHVTPLFHFELDHYFTGITHYIIDPWIRWDAKWYIQIAEQGYRGEDFSFAFFPLYPLLMAGLAPLLSGSVIWAGILISAAACLAAFCCLYRLVRLDFGPEVARKSVIYLAIFPTAFFLQSIYTESLFLALTIGSLYAARRRRWALAGLAGALAALSRSTGVLLLLPLAILYLQDRRRWRELRWDSLYLLLVPAGLGLWMLYLQLRFGDALAFVGAQSHWGRQPISLEQGGPLKGLWLGLQAAARGIVDIITAPAASIWPLDGAEASHLGSFALLDFGFAASFLALSIAAWWRLPKAYAAYAVALILLPLASPHIDTTPLLSMPRFVLPAFPVFILLALWGQRHRWLHRTLLVAFPLLLVLLTARFVLEEWVA